MGTNILIGIIAGLTAALFVAAAATGSFLAMGLTNAAGLPIMAATLGRGHLGGAIAAVTSVVILSFLLSFATGLGFALVMAVPAFLLAIILAEQGSRNNAGRAAGQAIASAALWGVGLAVIGAFLLGPTYQAYDAQVGTILEATLRSAANMPQGHTLLIGLGDTGRAIMLLKMLLPPIMVGIWVLNTIASLWLADLAAHRLFGQRRRFSFKHLRLPSWMAPLLAASAIASLAGGMVGVAAWLVIGGLAAAFALLGFVVLHEATRGLAARSFILGGVYFACLLLGWPMIGVALLGLADQIFDIRGAIARRPGRNFPNDHS